MLPVELLDMPIVRMSEPFKMFPDVRFKSFMMVMGELRIRLPDVLFKTTL